MIQSPSKHARSCLLAAQPHSRPRATTRRSGALTAALVVALALALSATTGCMVMDELDSAAAKMPVSKKKKDAAPGASGKTPSPAERLAASKSALEEHTKQWWKEAKTMTPGERPAGIVNCRLSDGMFFMSKDDCIIQGGLPVDGSS